ncbi:MAG: sigma-70 family RNA polymerase sigma factor [Opitutae bacterium]|nr:sigma-70 family RNA polymerase sigma factor [Opitutae bacterium]
MSVDASEHSHWFAEHVQPHEGLLRAWLAHRFPSERDIDDLMQEIYVRVLQARERSEIHAPKAFLFMTARNLAVDRARHRQISALDAITEIGEMDVLEDTADVTQQVSRHEEFELLTLAIQALPERCRQVLTLRKIYGLSQREIAAQLGISEHTVEVQVAKGVRRCAEFLAERGLP